MTRMRHEGPGFRPGEWAVLLGLDRVRGRDCYLVEFDDGTTSWWPVLQAERYEFADMAARSGRISA